MNYFVSLRRLAVAGLSAAVLAGCATSSTTGPATSSSPATGVATSTPTPATPAPASATSPASPATTASATGRASDAANQQLVTATTADASFEGVQAPATLADDLKRGGYVIVFRYTGAGGPASPVPAEWQGRVRDDGQRISDQSVERMKAYGQHVRDLGIPVNRVASSEYWFVVQHALAAFGQPVDISRDLTGSLDFDDRAELDRSLQALRNRTVTPPDAGSNTVLFTHQGKFDKAYGFYPDAGTTIIFHPDGSGTPHVVAVLGYDQFMALGR